MKHSNNIDVYKIKSEMLNLADQAHETHSLTGTREIRKQNL